MLGVYDSRIDNRGDVRFLDSFAERVLDAHPIALLDGVDLHKRVRHEGAQGRHLSVLGVEGSGFASTRGHNERVFVGKFGTAERRECILFEVGKGILTPILIKARA